MHGFSERVSSLEVGHLLGLRWFELADYSPDREAAVRQRRTDVWNQCKDLADRMARENRGFLVFEQGQWDELNRELDALDSALARSVAAGSRRCTELSYATDVTDITAFGDPGRTRVPTGVTVSCSCGASVAAYGRRTGEVERFIKDHDPRAVHTGHPVLKGAKAEWQPGENVAVCLGMGGHMVPTERCHCGYWAYWSLGRKMTPEPAVVGIVKGYGDTIEGDLGFRTSHAKIIAVYLPHWDTAAALALEERYQVDVYCSLGAMLLRHKAPEGQRPLRDDYWTHATRGDIPGPAPGAHRGSGGMNHYGGESYLNYARRIGLADPLAPCMRCGTVSCGTGQAFCNNCRALEAHEASKAQTLTGDEAQAQLHARREGWASGSTVSITPGTTYTWGGGGIMAGGGGNATDATALGGGGGSASTVSGAGYTSGGNGRSSSFSFQLSQAEMDEMIRKLGL